MKRTAWTPDRLSEARDLCGQMTANAAAKKMGVSLPSLENAIRRNGLRSPRPLDGATVDAPPSSDMPIAALVSERLRRFDLKEKAQSLSRLIPVRLQDDKPIGVLVHGDPHIDDPGTDLAALLRNAELVRDTPGLYAASVGDQQNNWVGRLARLYAEQSTTVSEAWRLTEHWIQLHGKRWLFIVLGNHDLWTGPSDPLLWISRAQGVPLLQEWDVRIALRFPGGREVRIHCAHDFPGSSQWNEAHSVSKALRMGKRDHVALCGHRHHFGYQPVLDPDSGGLMHALRVGSYKKHDEYARKLGHDGTPFPCVMITIDPAAPEKAPDRIKWFLDPVVGSEYLTFLRSRSRKAA